MLLDKQLEHICELLHKDIFLFKLTQHLTGESQKGYFFYVLLLLLLFYMFVPSIKHFVWSYKKCYTKVKSLSIYATCRR